MKLLIVCSTVFYDRIPKIKEELESKGYDLVMPNCYDSPVTSDDHEKMSEEEYINFFRDMYIESRDKIGEVDGLLVLNYTKVKNGNSFENYVGASTFLEIYEAFMQNKKIYMMNDIPDNMLYDDLKGMNPIILNGDVSNIWK